MEPGLPLLQEIEEMEIMDDLTACLAD